MLKHYRLCLLPILLLAFALPAAAQAPQPFRTLLPVPDLPGFKTLKGDFHLHTIFSDGNVVPSVHITEAWRDGLDVISLTEHVEYHPHKDYVPVDPGRSYTLGRPLAEQLGVLLIPGAEITKTVDGVPTHFNALFVNDWAALNVPDVHEALRRARSQSAFVFWNHPGWRVERPMWTAAVALAHEEKLFHGMELVNGPNFYDGAYPWIEEKKLTILANSDEHQPTTPRAAAGTLRPITLLFVKSADAAGVREALEARRTAAWLDDQMWGAEEYLRGLWQGAVSFDNAADAARAEGRRRGSTFVLRIRNTSAIPFRIGLANPPAWLGTEAPAYAVHPQAISRVPVEIGRHAPPPAGRQALEVQFVVENLHTGPGRALIVSVPLTFNLAK